MRKAVSSLVIAILFLQAMVVAFAYASPPDLERRIFIHYAKGAKPNSPSGDTGSYKLLGAKWQTLPITVKVNTYNSQGLSYEFIENAIKLAAGEWDNGTYSQSDQDPSTDWTGVSATLISGVGTTSKGYGDLSWTRDKLDGENTIVFGDYPNSGVIAVTIIWYSRATKTIIEFDMVLDTDYTWGNATELGDSVMDLQNIVTHELGHGLGLNDVYSTSASQETMYGYADYGETIKRTLYKGDMTGIKKLYGP